jgi:hypothetical protein
MGQTIQIVKNKTGKPVSATDLVYSPDDGGYYLSQHDFRKKAARVSEKVWIHPHAALTDFRTGAVKWEEWH